MSKQSSKESITFAARSTDQKFKMLFASLSPNARKKVFSVINAAPDEQALLVATLNAPEKQVYEAYTHVKKVAPNYHFEYSDI